MTAHATHAARRLDSSAPRWNQPNEMRRSPSTGISAWSAVIGSAQFIA
jgi:hypothetical protein